MGTLSTVATSGSTTIEVIDYPPDEGQGQSIEITQGDLVVEFATIFAPSELQDILDLALHHRHPGYHVKPKRSSNLPLVVVHDNEENCYWFGNDDNSNSWLVKRTVHQVDELLAALGEVIKNFKHAGV